MSRWLGIDFPYSPALLNSLEFGLLSGFQTDLPGSARRQRGFSDGRKASGELGPILKCDRPGPIWTSKHSGFL